MSDQGASTASPTPVPESGPGSAVPGVAVVAMFVGAVFVLAGTHRSGIADVARALVKGQPIPRGTWYSDPSVYQPSSSFKIKGSGDFTDFTPTGGGSATGAAVAASALAHLGVPYEWAGETPKGWDCSGMVTWILRQQGLNLPDNVHTTAAKFYVWSGATTIPRSQCAPGDLVCWPGHIGIAVSNTEMVDAPNPLAVTRRERIWSIPAPVIRRPNAYGI